MGIDSANKLLIIIMAIQFTAVFLGAAALLTAIMVIHSNDATPSYGKDFRLWQGMNLLIAIPLTNSFLHLRCQYRRLSWYHALWYWYC